MPETSSGASKTPNQGDGGPDELLSHTSTCVIFGHQPKQIACQEDTCSSGVWESACFRSYFQLQVSDLSTRARAHVKRTNTKYSKRVMRFLTPSPMLHLSLILCYINYIFNESRMALLVSAPSIHGNCQLVRGFTRIHTDTRLAAKPRCNYAWMTRQDRRRTNACKCGTVLWNWARSCSSTSLLNRK